MEIKYQIFEDENLLIQKFSGKWSYDKVKKSIQEVISNPKWKEVKKIFTDMRPIEFKAEQKDIDDLRSFVMSNTTSKFKHVQFSDKPETSVSIHRIQKEVKSEGRDFFYFNKLDKAINELGLNITIEDFEKRIKDLKNKI